MPDNAQLKKREPRGRTGAGRLTQAEIVQAALRLVDEQGAKALTMRRLADAVGAGVMTLYWHVANRDELHALVVDAALPDFNLASPAGSWREQVYAFFRAYYRAFDAHPNIAPLARRGRMGPRLVDAIEHLLSGLRQAGLSDTDAGTITEAASSIAWGFLYSPGHHRLGSPRGGVALKGVRFEALPTSEYPHIPPVAKALGRSGEAERFDAALKLFLEAYEAQLAKRNLGEDAPRPVLKAEA